MAVKHPEDPACDCPGCRWTRAAETAWDLGGRAGLLQLLAECGPGHEDTCPDCGGYGTFVFWRLGNDGDAADEEYECGLCRASGRVSHEDAVHQLEQDRLREERRAKQEAEEAAVGDAAWPF